MFNFINASVEEFKKVEWPTKDTAIRLTGYVIGVSLLVGLIVMGLDYVFNELLGLYLK